MNAVAFISVLLFSHTALACIEFHETNRVIDFEYKLFRGLEKETCAKAPYIRSDYKFKKHIRPSKNRGLMSVNYVGKANLPHQIIDFDANVGKKITTYQLMNQNNTRPVTYDFNNLQLIEGQNKFVLEAKNKICIFDLAKGKASGENTIKVPLYSCSSIKNIKTAALKYKNNILWLVEGGAKTKAYGFKINNEGLLNKPVFSLTINQKVNDFDKLKISQGDSPEFFVIEVEGQKIKYTYDGNHINGTYNLVAVKEKSDKRLPANEES